MATCLHHYHVRIIEVLSAGESNFGEVKLKDDGRREGGGSILERLAFEACLSYFLFLLQCTQQAAPLQQAHSEIC